MRRLASSTLRRCTISPETFDKWRVIPRLLILLYGWLCFDTHSWFTSLVDPTNAQQMYASIIWGGAVGWFAFYVNSGGKRE